MKRVGSRKLKNRLGRYLGLVEKGEVIVVTDRGKPVAKLVPAHADGVGGVDQERGTVPAECGRNRRADRDCRRTRCLGQGRFVFLGMAAHDSQAQSP